MLEILARALEFLRNQLKALPGFQELPDGDLEYTSISNDKGEWNIGKGKIALSLINIEEEKIFKAQLQQQLRNGDDVQLANPEIRLNLYLLAAVNPGAGMDDYRDALNKLTRILEFFQAKNFFEKAENPSLDPIEELIVELHTLSFEQQNQLWASLGTKYMPSVIYKVRLVVINRKDFDRTEKIIRETGYEFERIN